MMERKTRKQEKDDKATGCHAIVANEHLLTLILLFLPVKSLVRFKSVSKKWRSLITSSYFSDLKSKQFSKHIYGLFLRRIYRRDHLRPRYEFVPLDEDDNRYVARRIQRNPHTTGLGFLTEGKYVFSQYCNGLLLCRGVGDGKYYVFNPTTKKYITVPTNRFLDVAVSVNLAFDPRKSSHFKLICLYRSQPFVPAARPHSLSVGIYSSETGILRQIDGSFCRYGRLDSGLYWNGAVIWYDYMNDGFYFNVDEEQLNTLPMPSLPYGDVEQGSLRCIRYFGESSDHLHLIPTPAPNTTLDVYELERDFSAWFVKFRVDLQPIRSLFPKTTGRRRPGRYDHEGYSIGVVGVVREDDDDKSFLVLSLPCKVIRFNIEDGSFSELRNFRAANDHVYGWRDSFQFIGSLHRL